MKNLMVLLCLAAVGSFANADQVLQVISRTVSTQLNCSLQDIDEGYDTPMMVRYTVCDYSQRDAFIAGEKSKFQSVLKVEGTDDYSQAILERSKIRGEHLNQKFNIKITGVIE